MEKFIHPTEKLVYDFGYQSGLLVGRLVGQTILLDQRLADEQARAAEAARLARFDSLTGLLNRLGLEENGNERLQLNPNLALIYCDLDNFKQVNDTHGHNVGDRLLISAARTFSGILRKTDIVGRPGGDEFWALVDTTPRNEEDSPLSPQERVQIIADRIQNSFYPNALDDGVPAGNFGISIGFVLYDPARHSSLTEILRDADAQMYANKQARKQAGDSQPSTD